MTSGLLGGRLAAGVRRAHELPEQRVRPRGARAELRVELPRHEEGMAGQLDDLDEAPVGRQAREHEPAPREDLVVHGVHLEPVPVTLVHDGLAVGGGGDRSRHEVTGLGAQAHRAAEVRHVLLLGQQVDDRVDGGRVELGGVRALKAAHVARELDDGALQPQADPEERHALLAGVADRVDLASIPRTRTRPARGSRRPAEGPRGRRPRESSEATHVIWTSAPWWKPPCFSASITER